MILDLAHIWATPPIRSNDRHHWRAKAAIVATIRQHVAYAARTIRPPTPIDYPVTVTVVWTVTDRRVRDAGSIAPFGKAAIDGLVDAQVLARDSRDVVIEERYRVETGDHKGLRLEIQPCVGTTMPIPDRVRGRQPIRTRNTQDSPPDRSQRRSAPKTEAR